ncbi:hypothetical protein GCM10010238_44490 [Streptomyces griseoviridis]|uniref:Uncharacterized protein n=1 Tax=Streptomyces griseoviridis TaxID=45398 RepID=A0A918GPN5_STRGD|nr:hypothetical protein GCM10010238_44490 [Streptomyces niveoruber]GGT24801.1 hypothetical protein GCM10010240_66600 [Streptomyces griseoviridis]
MVPPLVVADARPPAEDLPDQDVNDPDPLGSVGGEDPCMWPFHDKRQFLIETDRSTSLSVRQAPCGEGFRRTMAGATD